MGIFSIKRKHEYYSETEAKQPVGIKYAWFLSAIIFDIN